MPAIRAALQLPDARADLDAQPVGEEAARCRHARDADETF